MTILFLLFLLLTGRGRPTAPSVVVYVLDDVGMPDTDHLRAQGKMPHLEMLAAQAVDFRNAYANPTCSPTRWCFQTGHWQTWCRGDPCSSPAFVPLSERFLPEEVPATASTAMVGKWHIGASPDPAYPWECAPWLHGWDHWYAGSGANVTACGGGYSFWDRVDDCQLTLNVTSYEPRAVTDIVTLGWNSVAGQKLAMVCPNLCHIPLHRPPNNLLPPGYPQTLPGPKPKFEAMLIASDALLGQMLTAINLADTVVIVIGDNGTVETAAPEPMRAKGTTYERGVRIPFLVAGAGIVNPGRVSNQLVHAVDLYQTVIDLMHGAPQTRISDGVSLVPTLLDQAQPPPHDFVLLGQEWTTPGGDVAAVSRFGVKLRWVDVDGDRNPETEQLFDLSLDPLEFVNLVADPLYADDLAELRAFMDAALP